MEYNLEFHISKIEENTTTILRLLTTGAERTGHNFTELERRLGNIEQTVRSLQQELVDMKANAHRDASKSAHIGGAV